MADSLLATVTTAAQSVGLLLHNEISIRFSGLDILTGISICADYLELLDYLIYTICSLSLVVVIFHYRNCEFNKLWKVRVVLTLDSLLWVLSASLRNAALWHPEYGIVRGSPALQSAFCNAHLVLSYGIAEPLFFVLIVFLVRSRSRPTLPNNASILVSSIAWTLPMLLIQVCIILLQLADPFVSSILLPQLFFFSLFSTYDAVTSTCQIPFITMAGLVFGSVIYLIVFQWIGRRFSKLILNHRLRNRFRILRWDMVVFVILALALRGIVPFLVTIDWAKLFILHVHFYLILLSCICILWLLIVRPIRDIASNGLLRIKVPTESDDDEQEGETLDDEDGSRGLYIAGSSLQASAKQETETETPLQLSAVDLDFSVGEAE